MFTCKVHAGRAGEIPALFYQLKTMIMEMKEDKLDEKKMTVSLKYSPHTYNFFIDFSNESGCLISVKITESVAAGLSKELNLKILI